MDTCFLIISHGKTAAYTERLDTLFRFLNILSLYPFHYSFLRDYRIGIYFFETLKRRNQALFLFPAPTNDIAC